MLVSRIGYNQCFLEEENLSVETVVATTAKNTYFQDGNPENTFVPFFNRALRAEQEKRMESEKKIRDLRKSEDYRLLQQQSKNGTKHIVDTYR